MASDKFRHQLRKEAQQWQLQGLITADQYQQLATRYRFDALDTSARDRFITVLIILGSVLLGIGVITFVAANWQAIPRLVKMALLLLLLISVNGVGFYLWRSPPRIVPLDPAAPPLLDERRQARQRLGHGLLILGALILGANLALMGQLFHQSGSAFGFFMLWGVGVWFMAWGLGLTSLAVLSGILVGLGYWAGVRVLFYAPLPPDLYGPLLNMPLIAALLFVPLAYWCRSQLMFGVAAFGVVSSLLVTLASLNPEVEFYQAIVTTLAAMLPAALLWSYDDELWATVYDWLRQRLPGGDRLPVLQQNADQFVDEDEDESLVFRPVSRALAIIYLGGLLYFFSFHGLWDWDYSTQAPDDFNPWALWTNPSIVTLMALTLGFWVYLGWPRMGRQWRLVQMDGLIAALIVAIGALVFCHMAIAPLPILAPLMFNALLFILAAGLVREGLADGSRRQFWLGLVLLILQVLSRVFEYETGLLVKSLAFLLCGVGVIIMGLWFERYVRSLVPSSRFNVSLAEDESP